MFEETSYGRFADVYDFLTDDVEYELRTDYIEKLIRKHFGSSPELVCDLGCGTGTVCSILNSKGYDCIGIDSSDSMLSIAVSKNTDGRILFLNQDICDFELYGTVDVFLCMLDTINYITDTDALERLFALVANYLNPGGIFIFDINTKHKFANILGNNTFAYEKENVFYTWENYYEDDMLDFYLNFFVGDDKGDMYRRFTEHHEQRYYKTEFLQKLAVINSLDTVGIYGELSEDPPREDDERIFVVLKKK